MDDGRILIGKQLKRLRIQAGMDLKQLAVRIGCTWQHLCNVESAKRERRQRHHQLSPQKIYRAAAALSEELGREVTVDELLGYPDPDEEAEAA